MQKKMDCKAKWKILFINFTGLTLFWPNCTTLNIFFNGELNSLIPGQFYIVGPPTCKKWLQK